MALALYLQPGPKTVTLQPYRTCISNGCGERKDTVQIFGPTKTWKKTAKCIVLECNMELKSDNNAPIKYEYRKLDYQRSGLTHIKPIIGSAQGRVC